MAIHVFDVICLPVCLPVYLPIHPVSIRRTPIQVRQLKPTFLKNYAHSRIPLPPPTSFNPQGSLFKSVYLRGEETRAVLIEIDRYTRANEWSIPRFIEHHAHTESSLPVETLQ